MSQSSSSQGLGERFLPTGTRVVLVGRSGQLAGVVREVRPEPHLKTYVVTCDDGSVVYASAYDVAREDDASRTPLGPRPEY